MTSYNRSFKNIKYKHVINKQTLNKQTYYQQTRYQHFPSQQTTIIPTTHLHCSLTPTSCHHHSTTATTAAHPNDDNSVAMPCHKPISTGSDDVSAMSLTVMWQPIHMNNEDDEWTTWTTTNEWWGWRTAMMGGNDVAHHHYMHCEHQNSLPSLFTSTHSYPACIACHITGWPFTVSSHWPCATLTLAMSTHHSKLISPHHSCLSHRIKLWHGNGRWLLVVVIGPTSTVSPRHQQLSFPTCRLTGRLLFLELKYHCSW